MVNIINKNHTHRTAIAEAIVTVSNLETIHAILEKKVPKGDVFESARVAGLFGIKKTSELIPDCHPLPIEFASVQFEINDLIIRIRVEVQTIYKTGVEVEAMHGASISALTIYDMLKPIDKLITISNIRLKSKKGGKSDFMISESEALSAAIVICSDSACKDASIDSTSSVINDFLIKLGVSVKGKEIIPDEIDLIQEKLKYYVDQKTSLIVFSGGTGLSKRDVTPEALLPLFDREVPGIMEAARQYGQQRMPFAMLSRSVAGIINQTLILAFPGSTNATKEYLSAIFPQVLHAFKVMKGERH
jgi:cyclic pyranopterin phosphate synthase